MEGEKFDPGFGKVIEWDIPLLEGYSFTFVPNNSNKPGTRSFNGIKNPGLIKAVSFYAPDAVLVNGWNFNSHLKVIFFFHKKIPVLFRGDSTLLDKKGFLNRLLKPIVLKQIFKKIDYALYVGEENKKYFIAHGLKVNQLVFVPHAIDNNRFAHGSTDNDKLEKLRNKYGIAKNKFVFLFAGKLETKKDPALLINTFKMLNLPGAVLLIAGNGVLEKTLKETCLDWPDIIFIDFQNQTIMPLIYGLSDVFVLPSKGPGETWGLAVNEAMACGKPVIVSNKCGCAPNLVRQGENGFIFPAGNKEALALAMKNIFDKRQESKNMGMRSAELIKDYSFDHIVTAVENTIEISK